jgi:hypothetical protein
MRSVWKYIILISVVLLAGCKDRSFRGDWDDYDDNPDNKNLYPVWISVGPYYGLPTKGDDSQRRDDVPWPEKTIYIYAFKDDNSVTTTYTTTSAANKRVCLIDGSKDGDMYGGKRGKRNYNDVLLYWDQGVEDRINYPRGNEPYRFYGYIYDDAIINGIERRDDRIDIALKITGGQDVMLAYSDPQVTYDALGDEFTQEAKDNILKYSYSEYTAKQNIYPQLLFRHLLTRFKFKMVAGQMEEERTIHLKSIRILSPSEAKFTVAHKNVENMGLFFNENDEDRLELREKNGSPLNPNVYYINTHTPSEKVDVGEYLMVAPKVDYVAEVTVYEDETHREYTNRIPLKSKEGSFPAGTEYLVTFTIFGIMDVRVDTELIGWIDGGTYEYDPEIKPNNIY